MFIVFHPLLIPMTTAEITYTGKLHTDAKHIRSGTVISTDAPIDNQGKGEAFSPTDLVGTALGTCILTIMGIAARTHEIDMKGAKAAVTKTMLPNPRRIGKLEVNITMPPNDYTEKQKAILQHAAHGCPVKRSLHPDLEEVIIFSW